LAAYRFLFFFFLFSLKADFNPEFFFMLASLNRFSTSWVAKILLGLLILSFGVFWGMGSLFKGGGAFETVAQVGSDTISTKDLQRQIMDRLRAFQIQTGRTLSPEEIQGSNLPGVVLSHMIQNKILDLEADQLGLVIHDHRVQNFVRTQKAFQEKGVFSRKKFQMVLRSQNMTEGMFLERIRNELRREQLLSAVLSPIKPPSFLVDVLINAQTQVREGRYTYVALKNLVPSPPTEGELLSFYDKNPSLFRVPEKRRFDFIILKPENIEKNLALRNLVSAEEVNKSFSLQQEIIYRFMQEADDMLAAGRTLQDVAKRFGLRVYTSPAVPLVTKDAKDFPFPSKRDEILDIVFKKKGPFLKTLDRLKDGSVLALDLKEVVPSSTPSFQSVRPAVKKAWFDSALQKLSLDRAQAIAASGLKDLQQKSYAVKASLIEEEKADLPPEVKTALFQLEPGQAKATQAIKGGAYAVLLAKVRPSGRQISPKKRKEMSQEIGGMLHEDVARAYFDSLRPQYRVQVNQQALALFYSQKRKNN
jgi:hypothetical protein